MGSIKVLISLIMPVKNLEMYLSDTLQSITQQRYQHWELIIVNDHSTDKTSAIIADFVDKDQRISSYQNVGKGIIPALQLALSKTKGAYVSRFDGDDIMPPNRLALMVKTLSQTAPKTIVTGKVKYFGDQDISEGYRAYEQWLNERIDQHDHWNWVYRECVIASPNWMLRKADLLAMGAFDSLTYPEDYDLVLQWHHHGFNIKCIPETILHWREHPARTSRNSEHYDQTHFFDLKVKHFVTHELGDSELILWGTDTKGKLTKTILDKLKTPFTWMEMSKLGTQRELDGQVVFDYRMIEKQKGYKLLIAVFPPPHQRMVLERYLHELGLRHGHDYHYL